MGTHVSISNKVAASTVVGAGSTDNVPTGGPPVGTLSEPDVTADGIQLARMLVGMDQQNEKSAKLNRRAQRDLLDASEHDQLSAMNDEKDAKFNAACIDAVTSAVQGVAGAAGAVASMNTALHDTGPALDARANAWSSLGQSGGSLLAAGGKFWSACESRHASEAEMRSKGAEMSASHIKSVIDDESTFIKQNQDAASRVLDAVKGLMDTAKETSRSALGSKV